MPCLLHEEARLDGAAGCHKWLEMPHTWLVSGLPPQPWPLLPVSALAEKAVFLWPLPSLGAADCSSVDI